MPCKSLRKKKIFDKANNCQKLILTNLTTTNLTTTINLKSTNSLSQLIFKKIKNVLNISDSDKIIMTMKWKNLIKSNLIFLS